VENARIFERLQEYWRYTLFSLSHDYGEVAKPDS